MIIVLNCTQISGLMAYYFLKFFSKIFHQTFSNKKNIFYLKSGPELFQSIMCSSEKN